MPYTFNGIGTTYYGERDKDAEGFYITTKFFVVASIPIIPLSSWRVRPVGKETGIMTRTQNYQTLPAPMNWRQVLNVYLVAIALVAAAITALALFKGFR